MNDLKFAFRQLLKNPGFRAVAVLTLALGIGANTAIFSVIHGVLLRPLPYRDPHRLVMICENNLKRGHQRVLVLANNLLDWRVQNTVFEDVAGEVYESFNLTGLDKPEHLQAAWVTANYFSLLGVQPFLGRTFVEGEDQPGHNVVVLSHGLWRRSFAADTNALGKTIALNAQRYTVVGVMPPGFKCFNPATVLGRPTGDVRPQAWVPYPFTPGELKGRNARFFLVFARLKPGVTVAQARNEMNTITRRLAERFPDQKDWGADVQPAPDQVVGAMRPALITLLGAAIFVLLIACANVANLLLARSTARRGEFAIRSALGAGRARIVRQLLTENLLLVLLGGVLGVLLARGSIGGLLALHPADVPRFDEIRLDGSVLGFTLLLSLVTGLVFGLAPALHSAQPGLNQSLKESGQGFSKGGRGNRGRHLLVAFEVALALILLMGSGLMMNSFVRLARVHPGFQPEQLLAMDVTLPDLNYSEASKRIDFAKRLRERFGEMPGVNSAATICGLPFGTMLNVMTRVTTEGPVPSTPGERALAGWRLVSPDYFTAMGIPLLKGRAFSERDNANSPPVAIINEALARKIFPGEDPVGKRLNIHSSTTNLISSTNWCEIVGVIKDVKLTGLDAPSQPEVYRPDLQDCFWMFSVVVRSSLPPEALTKMAQESALALDKDVPVYNLRTMDRAIAGSTAPRRFTMVLIGVFGALAIVLAGVGIYGVISYSVTRQRREIGIRMALGAQRSLVLGHVLRQGMMFVLAGMGVGFVGSLALVRLIANQLYDVTPTDPATVGSVALLLASVALLACYIPARQATKIDPMEALRCE
jgi:putative ABC transport system permease protein